MHIVFARKRTLGSWLIRLATWSRWSHCAVLDGDHVIDATFKHGVARRRMADWSAEYPEQCVLHVPVPAEQAAKEWLRQQVGKAYDWSAVLGFITRADWADDESWFCSELVEAAIRAGGRHRVRADVSRVTPELVWTVTPEPVVLTDALT